jgi:hypothetical protein
MKYRWAQQIRLWIYAVFLILNFLDEFKFINLVIFFLINLLFYLEVCPKCGRIVWWETNRWPNSFWISSKCKNTHSNKGHLEQ